MPDQPEPLWLVKSIPHSQYLATRRWKARRAAFRGALEARNDGVPWCELCGITGLIEDVRFDVHHLTYDRLGEERDRDLALLCSMCHNLVHHPDSPAARHWTGHNAHENSGNANLFETYESFMVRRVYGG